MAFIEYTRTALEQANNAVGDDGPVYMVNMLKYRDVADYGGEFGGAESGLPPCSGREAYLQRYVPAFGKAAAGEQFSLFWVGNVRALLVAPGGEAWDDVAIVQYSSFAALRRILENPVYEAEAAPHRRAALEDWRLIATTQFNLPG
jgi:hypothetical protein